MKKIDTLYFIILCTLVFASCSESDGLSNGIALSKDKIVFSATFQGGWNGGKSTGGGNSSRAGKPTFSGLAMEQKVLTANEGLAKPLYLHPLETENTSVMNAMPQTRGMMNESSIVGSFGVSAVYSKDGANSSLFQNEEATQNGSYWFTSGNATWPLDGLVSFYAYAPYNDASLSLQGNDDVVKNKTIRYTVNTDLSKQPDLIVAKSESNAFASSTVNKAVSLNFSHALTAITFSISADMIPGTVKSITVSGVYGQGDYDLSKASKASWASLATPSTYAITLNTSIKAGESKALTDKNSALMMIPQNLGADAKVSMVFNDGAKDKTVSFSLNGTSWTAGKHITYVLSSSKITTLNMGSLTYPTGWNSVNTGATNQIRTAYASNTSAGLFVVNEEKKVIAANVQLTYNGTSWSLPADSKLKFSPKYSYFVYYPYQASLAGLPAVNATVSDVSSSPKFFTDAVATWKSSKITADQSTLDKMNACDLQIGKALLNEDGCKVNFAMEHAMGLAVLNRETKSLDHFYKLKGYEDYTWSNGSVPTTANGTISGLNLFSTTATQGIMIVVPSSTATFTNTSTGKDEWINKSVSITINEGNKVYSGEAKLKLQHYDETTYTMEVGDIYYSDGAMTHQSEDLASDKTPIGIVGYLGNNYWTEKGVSGKGGHALVMCLKTIGSIGSTVEAQEVYKNEGNGEKVAAYIGTGYAWNSSSNSDAGRIKVNSKSLLVNSYNQTYGSGYTETAALIKKWGPDAAAAYQAKNYKTLPANSTKCTGWFLPTAGQFYAVMTTLGKPFSSDWTGIWDGNTSTHPNQGFFSNMTTVTTNVNNKLKKVGDTKYTEFFGVVNTWAWTSSEFSASLAIFVDSGVDDFQKSGSVHFDGTIGRWTGARPVRPFLAF